MIFYLFFNCEKCISIFDSVSRLYLVIFFSQSYNYDSESIFSGFLRDGAIIKCTSYTEYNFSHFGLKITIIVDTLSDFKCKMRTIRPV